MSRAAGALRLGGRAFGPQELVVMAVAGRAGEPGAVMDSVHAAVAEGADILEVPGRPGPGAEADPIPFIAAVRAAYPELIIGVSTGRPEVAREACAAGVRLLRGSGGRGGPGGDGGDGGSGRWLAEVAAEFGAGVVCSLAGAAGAAAAGVPAERIVIGVAGTRQLEAAVASGWPVLVSIPDRGLAGGLATAAVAGWLGARVFRVHQVLAARRALRMVAAIRGDIPPAYAVRGLALGL